MFLRLLLLLVSIFLFSLQTKIYFTALRNKKPKSSCSSISTYCLVFSSFSHQECFRDYLDSRTHFLFIIIFSSPFSWADVLLHKITVEIVFNAIDSIQFMNSISLIDPFFFLFGFCDIMYFLSSFASSSLQLWI